MPNLTLGAPIVKCLRKHTKAFLDCHLMARTSDESISWPVPKSRDGTIWAEGRISFLFFSR